jgi:hypothetical protein
MYFTMETRLFRALIIDWLLWGSVLPVPEGHMTVARRFIAGFENTCCRVPEGRPHTVRSCAQAKDPHLINRIALVTDISTVPPGRVQAASYPRVGKVGRVEWREDTAVWDGSSS